MIRPALFWRHVGLSRHGVMRDLFNVWPGHGLSILPIMWMEFLPYRLTYGIYGANLLNTWN